MQTNDTTEQPIDVTPTWADLLYVYIAVLRDGNAEGRAVAAQELRRMAAAADKWNASVREAQQ